MALDLGTIVTAVEMVQKAIELCNKIVDLPEKMKALGRRMERQNILLLQVEKFVKKYATGVDPILEAGQRTDLMRIIGNIKENAVKVYELLERVDKGILSAEHNLEFRSKTAARIWYALIERPNESIEAIMEDINHDRKELSDYVNIISAEISAKGLLMLKANAVMEAEQREKEKEKEKEAAELKKKTKDKGKDKSPSPSPSKPATTTNTSSKPQNLQVITVTPPKTKIRASPSPSPLPLRQDYKILFVDPRNQARSVVAQSLLLLLGALTTTLQSQAKSFPKSASAAWRISQVHSAGFFVSHKSTLTPSVTSSLPYSHKSYKMGPFPGNEPPNPVALSAVFDNKSYPYAFKSDIQKRMVNRRSVGLTENAFKDYDYIIVFTNREHDNMVRLKDALIKMGKLSVRERGGKGRVLHLGTYIPQRNGAPREILAVTPRKDKNGKSLGEDRADWNKKAGEIKTALKGFLKEEMDWVMPDQEVGKATAGGKDALAVPK
ncbi:hypothetical protein V8F20_006145 [Naviculisporaceae sp. PSN 640]